MKLTKKQLILIVSAAVLLVALITVLVIVIINAAKPKEEREIFSYNSFDYVVGGDGKIEIIKYNGSADDVVVPTVIDNRSVTSIGDGAFRENKMKAARCWIQLSYTIFNAAVNCGF